MNLFIYLKTENLFFLLQNKQRNAIPFNLDAEIGNGSVVYQSFILIFFLSGRSWEILLQIFLENDFLAYLSSADSSEDFNFL